ncbi:hypothetical protein J25TS5_42330 [Paenibacillus faecis]|nr:hypothetical protein J25TS5_42330 [Paenibacillus faecis]
MQPSQCLSDTSGHSRMTAPPLQWRDRAGISPVFPFKLQPRLKHLFPHYAIFKYELNTNGCYGIIQQ